MARQIERAFPEPYYPLSSGLITPLWYKWLKLIRLWLRLWLWRAMYPRNLFGSRLKIGATKFEDRKFGDFIRNMYKIRIGNKRIGIGNLGILAKIKSKNQKFRDRRWIF